MEILTKIKTPQNFNSKDLALMNAAEEEILENLEFSKLQQEHKFCDLFFEDANGFIKVIF
jgi:hypothetical protein